MIYSKTKRTLLLAALLASAMASAASHADSIEEIVVTADLLNRPILDLATSVSVIDESRIKARNAVQLEQLLNLAPNVNFSSGASRGRYIQIRGIGERSEFIEPLRSSVGVILDGIDLTGISTAASTLDIAQVEILRGPQGTVFGANALAGLINLRSNAPTDEFEGSFGLDTGNYSYRNISGVINLPLNDETGLRISAMQTQANGFIDNTFLNADDTNDIDETTIQAKLAWQPSDSLSMDITALYADVDNGYDSFSFESDRNTRADQPGEDVQETSAFSLQSNWVISDGLTLESLVSYATSDLLYSFDEDWSNPTLCATVTCPFGDYSSFDNYDRENKTSTVDLRLVSNAAESQLDWVAGLYYRDQDRSLFRVYSFDTDFSSDYDTKNLALYSELDVPLADRLTLSVGARYENFEGNYIDNRSETSSPDEGLWGGKVSLEYALSQQHSAYLLISRGYKESGFNADSTLDEDQRQFDAEILLNYEAGIKGTWLDGRVSTLASVFYQGRKDIQVATSIVEPLTGIAGDPCPCRFIEFTDNAAEGSSIGLELETTWYATERTSLFLTLGLLDAEFDNYTNFAHVDAVEVDGIGVDLSGHDQPHAPNYMFNAGINWNMTEDLLAQIDIEGKDSFFLSDSHEEKSDSYTLLNARLNYKISDVEIALWGRNLTDKDVIVRGFGSFGNDPRNSYTTEPYLQFGEPRVFGISGQYSF